MEGAWLWTLKKKGNAPVLRKSKTIFVTFVPFVNAVTAINYNKPTSNLLGDIF
jgi:hypothetical protein